MAKNNIIDELDETKITDVWKDYEKGVMYNRMMHLYDDTEDNYDFYYGNHKEPGRRSGE